MQSVDLDVIIPAFNEEHNLEATVEVVLKCEPFFRKLTVYIVDDGSSDGTNIVAQGLVKKFKNVILISHDINRGLGQGFLSGLKAARGDYVLEIHGKNDITFKELYKIINLVGKKDLVIPYTMNTCDRSLVRRFISQAFVNIMNYSFGLKLKYYNHSVLYKRADLNLVELKTSSYFFQAELLVKLILLHNKSYSQVGVYDDFHTGITKTNAFRLRNIWGVFLGYIKLLNKIYLSRKRL